MLSTSIRSSSNGFTLIELMVGLIVIAILMSLAVPSFSTWMQNSQIRNAAESVLNGLQRARAEAVSRNANVEFVLGAGTSWEVQLVDGTGLDSRTSDEGSDDSTVTVTPAGATTITFNNFGGLGVNADTSATITQVEFDSLVLPAADSHELRVTIGLGGSTRMCNPTIAPPNPRAC
ncbi:MAG: GspH/FimT family pseudopilin [Gallionella sp.]